MNDERKESDDDKTKRKTSRERGLSSEKNRRVTR